LGYLSEVIDGLIVSILLGLCFLGLQIYEYYTATFNIVDSVYASTFYMLTGLHGCHVFVGVFFLIINLIRVCRHHFTVRHYLGLVFAI
jgi:heme/copper-type cytochrome/quinol oxidase subunit 3